jgi:hypothetical protein
MSTISTERPVGRPLRRGFSRTENVGAIPPADADFTALYARRNDAEPNQPPPEPNPTHQSRPQRALDLCRRAEPRRQATGRPGGEAPHPTTTSIDA